MQISKDSTVIIKLDMFQAKHLYDVARFIVNSKPANDLLNVASISLLVELSEKLADPRILD